MWAQTGSGSEPPSPGRGLPDSPSHLLRFIQEVNTTTRSCALWDLEEDTEYIVHVQAISIQGQSPASEPVLFKTPREAEKMASKNKGRPRPPSARDGVWGGVVQTGRVHG